jgi:putative transposase
VANTYSQIYIQVVFAVSERQCLIAHTFKEELYKYIAGTVRNEGQKVIAINGMPDHIHILIGLKPDVELSKLVGKIKTSSANFINSHRWIKGRFSWQEGFGAFSYSRSQVSDVARYIENQEVHHTKRSFKSEYLSLLRKFQVSYDERYLFQWVDEA